MINYKEHRRLWNWLADHPEMDKEDYFKGWPEECIPDNRCFACEEAQERWRDSETMKYSWDPDAEFDFCEFCPIGGLAVMGCFFRGQDCLKAGKALICQRKKLRLPARSPSYLGRRLQDVEAKSES